jgi:outer membrane protein assembly factor BamB
MAAAKMLEPASKKGLALLVFGVAVFVCGAAPVDNPREAKAAEPVPFPDGVTDAERRTAFVSSPKGGVQAVRLEDGKVLWANDACAAQPWLVAGGRLIARGDRLFVLDIKNEGKVLRQCDAPDFPKVNVPDRCTVSFPLWDPRVAGDALEARWYCVAAIDRSKGRPFPFEAWTAFNKAVPVGTVKFNLETGKATLQTDPKPADVTAGLIPEAAKPEQRMPADMPEKMANVWRQYHKDQNGRVTVLGDRLVGVSMTLEPVGREFSKKVTLNSWDVKTGAAAEPVELVKDKATNIANIVLTGDRRHAAVVFGTSAVTVYSLADGKAVAREVKGVASPEQAFVDGKRLYFAELTGGGGMQSAHTLKALDLESGKVVWERPLKPRSTVPLPP